MGQLLLRQRLLTITLFQILLILSSLVIAWSLRFEFKLPNTSLLIASAPLLVVIRLAAIWKFNLFHGWWRYTGVSDALDIAKAVVVGSIGFFVINRYVFGNVAFPLSVYALEALLTGCSLAGVRLLSRIIAESVMQDSSSARVLIIGAGQAGALLIREIKQQDSGCFAAGFVDDNKSKRHLKIQGVSVLGTVDELPTLVVQHGIEEVLIAVPSATGEQMKRFVEICERSHVRFKTVPSLKDLLSGEVSIKQVRNVNVEDLLGREPIQLNVDLIRDHLRGRTVMVTGAAGSIGSELCRQIVDCGPSKLICVDHNETGIFYLERELSRRKFGNCVQYSVADIRDVARMGKLMLGAKLDFLFHAAAYKHVPVMETNVPEAVNNNVFGLTGLLEIAQETGCGAFILISSDKAVMPTSVMGCTKRLGELIMAAWPASDMRCISVRFGNVLGSSGSVIPLFAEQIRNGQPLTITHPEIQRFFMTIREAVALVLQGSAIGRHRDILVLDMGSPVKIVDLAESLVRLSGKNKEQVSFKFTGLRPGEKLYEDLFYANEVVMDTACEKIKRTQGTVLEWDVLAEHLKELESTLFIDGAAPIKKKINEIIPQYKDAATLGEPLEIAPARVR